VVKAPQHELQMQEALEQLARDLAGD